MQTKWGRRAFLAGTGASVALPRLAAAQAAFPAKPIRIVHGYSAASNPDTIARVIAPSMIETLGQSVIVEPKPGAGERIAAQYLMTQPADGYTLYLITGGANVISATDPQTPFNTLKDFSYVSTITLFPFALFVAANSPLQSFKDLRAAALARPGKLNYGHSGVGNTLHLAVEYLKALTDMKMEAIAYKDTGQQINDVLTGRLDVAIGTFTGYHGALANRQARAIGVTSKEVWPLNPDVPPIALDVPGYEVVGWNGLFVVKDTPPAIAGRIYDEVAKALRSADVKTQMAALGAEPGGNTPAEFTAFVRAESARWGRIIQDKGIRPE